MNKKRLFTIVLIGVGLFIVVFFGMRVMRSFKHMRGDHPFEGRPFDGKPPAANQADAGLIRDWMTIIYIADLYDVPPGLLFKTLEIPDEKENGKKSLKKINDEYYPDQPGVVLLHVQAVIQALQIQEPPPHFPATPVFTATPSAP